MLTAFDTIAFGFRDVWSFSLCLYHTQPIDIVPWLRAWEMLALSLLVFTPEIRYKSRHVFS
jgi:hypothetical protein